jgi:hypothetical protein
MLEHKRKDGDLRGRHEDKVMTTSIHAGLVDSQGTAVIDLDHRLAAVPVLEYRLLHQSPDR